MCDHGDFQRVAILVRSSVEPVNHLGFVRLIAAGNKTFSLQHVQRLVSNTVVPKLWPRLRCNPSHVLQQEAVCVRPLALTSAFENSGQYRALLRACRRVSRQRRDS